MILRGKTALVTGGARRIGRAIALLLGERGMRVAITYLRSIEEAASTVQEINARGGKGFAIPADLATPDAADNVVGLVRERFGKLHVLVNNAAVFPRTPLEETTPKVWNRILNLNLRAPFLLARAAAPEMRAAGGGAIVNVTDIYAERALPEHVPYVASKAGLVGLTRALARELAPEILVNAIAPGAILWPDDMSEERREAVLRRIPLGRKGEPEDVARAVVGLLQADFVTGAVIPVDGGRLLG